MNDIDDLEDLIPGISSNLAKQFREFFEMISRYNLKLNLVAKSTISRAVVKHFSDSFQGLSLIEPEFQKGHPIFDFGSGNGFPGIVAAMMFPSEKVILVEKDIRKAEFLKIAADDLKLKNVQVHSGNLQDLAENSVVNAVSRAMSPLPRFLLEARPVLAEGGKVFLFKSDHWTTEFGQVPAQVFEFWEVDLLNAYELPKADGKRFIVRCLRV